MKRSQKLRFTLMMIGLCGLGPCCGWFPHPLAVFGYGVCTVLMFGSYACEERWRKNGWHSHTYGPWSSWREVRVNRGYHVEWVRRRYCWCEKYKEQRSSAKPVGKE